MPPVHAQITSEGFTYKEGAAYRDEMFWSNVPLGAEHRTVHVGNITASITKETLPALFAHCGQVTNVRITGYVQNPSAALAGDGRGRCST